MKFEPSGKGGTFTVDVKGKAGEALSGTFKCDAFTAAFAEGGNCLGGRVLAPAFLLHRFIVVPQVSTAVAPAIGTVTRKQLQDDRVSVALGAFYRDRDFQL